ncbi:hypothetical protein PHAVU_008G036701 [Phaseolus vulgaris]
MDASRIDIFEIYRRYSDIKSGHAYIAGEEGYRQDSDVQKAKFSRDALTQLSKLVESRVMTGSRPKDAADFEDYAPGNTAEDFMKLVHKIAHCVHPCPHVQLKRFYLRDLRDYSQLVPMCSLVGGQKGFLLMKHPPYS